MADLAWLPFLLQTSDALFPTGAYAHSLGFEESVRLGLVRDEASLGRFLREQICPAQEHHELPYLRFAFLAENLAERCALDAEISAWKLARESREASAQLGGRRSSRPDTTDFPAARGVMARAFCSRRTTEVREGGTPSPTRGTRVLPGV